MKSATNALAILLLMLGMAGCTVPLEESLDTEASIQQMEENLEAKGIEIPANWAEMNVEEKREYLQSHSENLGTGQGMGNGAGGNMDRMQTRFEEAGVEMPENWTELSREERQEFMNENGM